MDRLERHPLSLRLLLLIAFYHSSRRETETHVPENVGKTRDSLPWVRTLDLYLDMSLHLFTNTDFFSPVLEVSLTLIATTLKISDYPYLPQNLSFLLEAGGKSLTLWPRLASVL